MIIDNNYRILSSSNIPPIYRSEFAEKLINGVILDYNKILSDKTITGKVFLMEDYSGRKVVIKPKLNISSFIKNSNNLKEINISFFDNEHFSTAHREALTYILFSRVFGLFGVPATTIFIDPNTKLAMSAQSYVDNHIPFNDYKQLGCLNDFGRNVNMDILFKYAIADTIIGNYDRNKGNILCQYSDSKFYDYQYLHLIDNALTFDFSRVASTPIPAYSRHILHNNLPDSTISWVMSLQESDLSSYMDMYRAPSEIIIACIKRIKAAKKFITLLRANKGFSRNLGHILAYMRTFFFCDDQMFKAMENCRKVIINSCMRGDAFDCSKCAESDDKTEIV